MKHKEIVNEMALKKLKNCKQLTEFSKYSIYDNGIVINNETNKICHDYKKGNRTKEIGYRKIKLLNDNGQWVQLSLHKLIWLSYFGAIPQGYEIDHIDRNRGNNCIDNLRVIPITANRKREKIRGES
jgi:hypothetical protein